MRLPDREARTRRARWAGVVISFASCAFAATASSAGEAPEATFRVYLSTVPSPSGRYGSMVLQTVLRASPLFEMVRDASQAQIVMEPTSHIPTVPPDMQIRGAPPIPPQPCYVVIRHTSRILLPGSVQAHAATCHEAARKALRGLAAQLLEPPRSMDGSI